MKKLKTFWTTTSADREGLSLWQQPARHGVIAPRAQRSRRGVQGQGLQPDWWEA